MDATQKLLQGIAAVLWPLIAIFLVVRFRPAIAAIIESARSRKFTIKIGGQELTMEEANQVQQNLIADLQNQVSEIQKKLGSSETSDQLKAFESVAASIPKVPSILWVDDVPKNNSYFIQQLSDIGVKIDLAQSTLEGEALLKSRKYDFLISDMGRKEALNYNKTAGIDFLEFVRKTDKVTPLVIYCSSRALRDYGQKALELGATAVTASPTELSGILKLAAVRDRT
ncbi:MAG: response regulator [Terracidiphilus sp.]|jgi:CheY-like chemotaxis protein